MLATIIWWVLEGTYREARRSHVSFAFSKVKRSRRAGYGLLVPMEPKLASWLQLVIISGQEQLDCTGLFFVLMWPTVVHRNDLLPVLK